MPKNYFAGITNEEFIAEYAMPKTPESENFMYTVIAIDEGKSDLIGLLKALDDSYSGVIDIHEGYDGVEADSNQDLISQKIEFDLRENFESHNKAATLEAIKLNWINCTLETYQELLAESN